MLLSLLSLLALVLPPFAKNMNLLVFDKWFEKLLCHKLRLFFVLDSIHERNKSAFEWIFASTMSQMEWWTKRLPTFRFTFKLCWFKRKMANIMIKDYALKDLKYDFYIWFKERISLRLQLGRPNWVIVGLSSNLAQIPFDLECHELPLRIRKLPANG